MDQHDHRNQRVLILGMGISGRSAARFLLKRGAVVHGLDQNRDLIRNNEEIEALSLLGLTISFENRTVDPASFDLVVVSPGVPQTHPVYAEARKQGMDVIGEVELACRHLRQPCLAVTGSNGKTTTTMLITHVLNNTGKKARALGNIGTPLTSMLDDPAGAFDDIIVLELSSWQLETMASRCLDAAVILNITPNHLDRHGTMESYARAKFHVKDCLKPGKSLFVGSACLRGWSELLEGFPAKTFGYEQGSTLFCDMRHVLSGINIQFDLPPEYRDVVSHDVENIMAAYAMCREMGIEGMAFIEALASFRKPPHRIEFVRRVDGVAYYNDSKGTSLDAVAKAVASMNGSTILIAGGVHKGASYSPWLKAFDGRVRCVYAIGQAAEQIREDLGKHIPVETISTLEEAVKRAFSIAKEKENVLLSPGCASFDMFKDYNHRGDEFKRLVHELEEKK